MSIESEEIGLHLADCFNRDGQINALLRSLHYLSSLAETNAYDGFVEYFDCEKGFDEDGNRINENNKNEEVSWILVPKSAKFVWDEEGEWSNWLIEREPAPTPKIDFDLRVTIEVVHKEKKTYHFQIRYQKMCYMVAKACMEMIKRQGLYYYTHSSKEDLSLISLMFIKAVAMNRMDVFDIEIIDVENDTQASSFEKEMAFLMEDMPEWL